MRCLALIIGLFLSSFYLHAQKASAWIAMGDESWEIGDYYAANAYYKNAYDLDTTKFDVTVKYAESLRMIKDYSTAEYYYQKLLDKDRGKIFRESQFWLAMMQKYSGEYKEALRNFKKYKKKVRKKKESYWYLKTQQEIISCTWAQNQRRDENDLEIKHLNEKVNSIESEFAPVLYQDTILFFSSMRTKKDVLTKDTKVKIYSVDFDSIAQASNDSYKLLQKNELHQANISFNKDETKAYYSECDSIHKCKIMVADIEDGIWKNVRPMESVNAENVNNTMPFLADIKGKEVLFFVSNREGGKGGMDIWWSENINGKFQKPINASDKINSPDNELSPFYMDGHLYFSSEWHEGFGGQDIFKSKGHPRSFMKAENLGYPINSSANDLYYTFDSDVYKGFFASNRKGSMTDGNETCCNDIYMFELIDPEIEIIDSLAYVNLEDLNKYLPVTLYFHNDEPNPRTVDTTTTLSYLDAYSSYKKLKEKYEKENSKGYSGEQKDDAIYDVEDFFAFYVDKGVQDLDIFSILLLEELKTGTKIELSVKGFASPLAKSDYNVNLTKRRISSLVNYLNRHENGIFRPYLNDTSLDGGFLSIIEIPFGEYKADQEVSDASDNQQESIYSRGARLERKIEIMSVQRLPEDSIYATLSFEKEVHDFGKISGNKMVEYVFEFKNEGNDTLYLDSIKVDCGCTTPEISRTIIPPGESADIKIQFDPSGNSGIVNKGIQVFHSAAKEPKRLTITAEIE